MFTVCLFFSIIEQRIYFAADNHFYIFLHVLSISSNPGAIVWQYLKYFSNFYMHCIKKLQLQQNI